MSFLKKLFGGGGGGVRSEAPAEEYDGFHIALTPIKEGDTYRVCALIEKDVDGNRLSHKLVRADTVQGLEAAQAASLRKAKQVIDEQGDRLFGTN
ncbi:MAG: HlyU family transcriptional regulator [Pseudomonadota bacterium]